MYCPKCGAQLQDGQRFCSDCGAQVGNFQTNNVATQNIKTTQKSKNNKILMLILVIVIVFIMLLAAIGSSDTPTSTQIEPSSKSTTTTETTTKNTQNLKNTISVTGSYVSAPDYAGGVDYHFEFTNLSDKEIKYLTVKATPYNAVGDSVKCEIRMQSQFSGKITGPIAPGESYGSDKVFRAAWYNNSITAVAIDSITIEYMDGSEVSITDKSDIEKICS